MILYHRIFQQKIVYEVKPQSSCRPQFRTLEATGIEGHLTKLYSIFYSIFITFDNRIITFFTQINYLCTFKYVIGFRVYLPLVIILDSVQVSFVQYLFRLFFLHFYIGRHEKPLKIDIVAYSCINLKILNTSFNTSVLHFIII